MEKLYVFKIQNNERPVTQKEGRNEIIKLLNIAPIEFQLTGTRDDAKRVVSAQEFAFETQEEARTFALRLLETSTFFFCELKKVEVL